MKYITRSLFCLGLGVLASACGGSDESVADEAPAAATQALPFKGVNLAGAEFAVDPYGNGSLPGTHGVHYMYPDAQYATGYNSPDYFLGKGMTAFRLPFRWERLQPTRKAAFDAAELARLTTTVSHLTAKGATVMIDPHNYARYGTQVIGSAAVPNADFADLWTRLANTFKGNSKVVFDLMNEPHDMPTEQWASAANAAIAAIRATGATNLILVPGNGWDGAGGWTSNWYGTPNATAMLSITDPGNNYAFEVHQYLDADSSGTNPVCPSATAGSQAMSVFTNWLRQHGKRGFLGEFGTGNSATCLAGVDDMLKHIEQNADVYLGWTYWAGGPWWGQNWMMVEPSNGADVAQMTNLVPHLAATSLPATPPPPACSDRKSLGAKAAGCSGSTPAPQATCTAKTYPTSSMYNSVGGATTGGWNLWSNGYSSTNHAFTAGATTITVRAKGSPVGNVWPHMVVSVGGTVIGQASVQSSSFTSYPFTFTATAGTKEIRVTFDNDAASTTEDRNLYLESVAVSCGGTPAPAPTSTPASSPASTPTPASTTPAPAPTSLPATGTLRIMPLGDSITLGVNGGYRNGLWTRLTNAGKSIDFVGSQVDQYAKAPDHDHEGHPGFTIGNIAASATSWVSSTAPDYVLLMIGTNDVAWWCAQTGVQVADQNALLIDQILAAMPNTWVVVGSIAPLTSSIIQPNNVDRAQLGKDYNAALQQRVQTRISAGKKVRWADVNAVLTTADLYDGVHPTEAAADKVAQVWYNALQPILP